jgi:hypothetical protein
MASHSDDLNYQHLIELHRKVDLLLKVVARQQDQLAKLSRRRDLGVRGRNYLRNMIREQRVTIANQKLYIVQLENELRLRGLE